MHSTATASSGKPRAYFTHGGRVTVDPNAPKPEKPAVATKAAPPAPAEEKTLDKKKSRFSLHLGKKTAAK